MRSAKQFLPLLMAIVVLQVVFRFGLPYSAACEVMVRLSRRFAPRADLAEVYAAEYTRYRRFLEAMEPEWKGTV